MTQTEQNSAAEQRRKDAEGANLSWLRFIGSRIEETTDRVEALKWANGGRIITKYRPANVAALEARIAELQAENDHQRTQILEFRNDDRRIRLAAERVCSMREGSEIFEARIALRAALTREGGV